MLDCSLLYYTVLCCAVLCCAMMCNATECHAVARYATLCLLPFHELCSYAFMLEVILISSL